MVLVRLIMGMQMAMVVMVVPAHCRPIFRTPESGFNVRTAGS
mgnify:CR=1 FL=1